MNTYFYAGYGDSAANGGLHHRSISEAGAAAHMAHDSVKFASKGLARFVVRVTGTYMPPRVNDRRGTLTAFLLSNTIEAAAGTAVPAWVAVEAAARRQVREAAKAAAAAVTAAPAPVASTAVLVPNAAVLVDVLATVARRDHLRPVGSAPIGTPAAEVAKSDIPADVTDPAGSAELVEAGELADSDERDEWRKVYETLEEAEADDTPEERKARIRANTRKRAEMLISAKSAE